MSFDRLAPHYNWLETLTAGGRLDRARAFWLGALERRQRVLSVGEGHGKFAHAFVRRFPSTSLTGVEASAPMLEHAKRRLHGMDSAINWVQSDFFSWEPQGKYDAIVTCFFLDCFPTDLLGEVVAKLTHCAEPDAVWLIVDFAVPARGMARWRAKAVHALMYWFFRIFTNLPARRQTEPDPLLRAHGFELERRQEFEWGLIRADVWRKKS
jgi:ubiquinone/menaquinone biosynthesis C-methylase UbiE